MPSSDFPASCMSGVRVVPFPDRSIDPSTVDDAGISRFPCKEFPRMLRVFDCAGSEDGSPMTPPSVWPSASDNGVGTPEDLISQLNGWPACAPVNASPPALRPSTHDSGSGWLAGPFPCDSFIHNSSPVFRRTIRPVNCVLPTSVSLEGFLNGDLRCLEPNLPTNASSSGADTSTGRALADLPSAITASITASTNTLFTSGEGPSPNATAHPLPLSSPSPWSMPRANLTIRRSRSGSPMGVASAFGPGAIAPCSPTCWPSSMLNPSRRLAHANAASSHPRLRRRPTD